MTNGMMNDMSAFNKRMLTVSFSESNDTLEWNKENGLAFVSGFEGFLKPKLIFDALPSLSVSVSDGSPSPALLSVEVSTHADSESLAAGYIPTSEFAEIQQQLGVSLGRRRLSYGQCLDRGAAASCDTLVQGLLKYSQKYREFWHVASWRSFELVCSTSLLVPGADIDLRKYLNFGVIGFGDFGKLDLHQVSLIFPNGDNGGGDADDDSRAVLHLSIPHVLTLDNGVYSILRLDWVCCRAFDGLYVKTFEESLKENTDAMAAVIESRVNKMFTQEGRALFTTRLSVLDEFPTFTGTI